MLVSIIYLFFLLLYEFLTGKDSTEAFERVFHSPKARGMLKNYLIGTIAASSRSAAGLMVTQGLGQGNRRTGYPSLQ